jgi:hypothetical protein
MSDPDGPNAPLELTATPAETVALDIFERNIIELVGRMPAGTARIDAEIMLLDLRTAGLRIAGACETCRSYRACDGPDCCGCCPGWSPK